MPRVAFAQTSYSDEHGSVTLEEMRPAADPSVQANPHLWRVHELSQAEYDAILQIRPLKPLRRGTPVYTYHADQMLEDRLAGAQLRMGDT
jgi:hypothetical protein